MAGWTQTPNFIYDHLPDSIKSTLICCLPLTLFPVKSVRCYDVSRYL